VNVSELKKMLDNYPDKLEVLVERFSDYSLLYAEDLKMVKGVSHDGWVMRSHETMSTDNKAKEKDYLYLGA